MIGGTFSDLTHMDPSSKTIILMGEEHTSLDVLGDTSKYDVIERKQKAIIDFVIEKFTGKRIMFYSEAPNDTMYMIMEDESLHSSRVIRYASTKMPIQLSHVNACHRESHGSCDDRYASEILQIIKDGFDCVIVQIGLFHVPYIRDLIRASAAESHIDVRIVIINTVSQETLTRSERNINEKYPKVAELLKTEPSYDLPRYSATIVKNESGVDVYKCPVCNALSSPAAVFVPTNASYFIHNPGCENATKVPTSESHISRTMCRFGPDSYNPSSPAYSSSAPAYNPTAPAYSSSAPAYNPTAPAYSSSAPAYSGASRPVAYCALPSRAASFGAASFGRPSWAAEEPINYRERALKQMEEASRKFEEASRKLSNGSVEEVEEVD